MEPAYCIKLVFRKFTVINSRNYDHMKKENARFIIVLTRFHEERTWGDDNHAHWTQKDSKEV